MQKRFLETNFSLSLKWGRQILIVMAALTFLLALFIPRLKISTSRQDLIPANHPEQARYLEFTKEFGATDNLIIVLEGETEVLKATADAFVAELNKEKQWVESIFYKIDTDVIMKHAPLFVPIENLEAGLKVLKKHHGAVGTIADLNNLMEILQQMKVGMKAAPANFDPETAQYIIYGVNTFFHEWSQWIQDPTHNSIAMLNNLLLPPAGKAAEEFIKSDGYLFSRDYRMLFLMVKPKNYSDDIVYLQPFISDMRKACDRVYERFPSVKDKLKVAFTGMPAHVLAETETIYSDVGRAGIISIFLVAIILYFGFGSIRKMLIGVIPLACGMIITLGLISLTFGRLNLISSAFLAVLFGIGIDFGIYLIRRTEEELGNGLTNEEAVHKAVVLTGKGIITGGFTTGLAFLAIALSDFVGYSELGIVAGSGVFIVLLSTLLMMPPLLMHFSIEPRQDDVEPSVPSAISARKGRTLWLILVPSVLFTIFSIFSIFHIKMDYNVLKLLPRNMESTQYNMKMEQYSNYKSSIAFITTSDFKELKQISAKLKELPTVSRVDSLAEVLPDNQDEKIGVVRKFSNYLFNFSIPYYPSSASASEYVAVLNAISAIFVNAQEDAFAAGHASLVDTLEKVITTIDGLAAQFSGENRVFAMTRTRNFEKELYKDINRMTEVVQDWLKVRSFSEADLSPELSAHFKSARGTYVIYVSPSGDIWDLKFLDRFVEDLRSLSKTVTGFPVTHRVYVRLAARAIIEAVVFSFLVVIFLLAFDFRKANAVILSLVPLVVGITWLQAGLYVTGISYNVANIAGLPLLLGLGVVYGVHIVHRWLENPRITAFAASHTTGRGVSFAALTTISGLFSIVFARHSGVSSFGVILLLGIALCLITALFLLPTIIDLIYLRPKHGEDNDKK
jgi:hopanoid biosynthesis associated RND transporter like protein HpnN